MKVIIRLLVISLITLCFATAASAATFVVNSTNDTQDTTPGDGNCLDVNAVCSLRAAITEANALTGDDIINVPPGTYSQTLVAANEDANAGGDWDITSNITINGAGLALTQIQAAGSPGVATERVMESVLATNVVIINNVTLRHGNKTGAAAAATRGGGIRNFGTLTMNNCLVTLNNASGAGGVRNERTITLNNVFVTNNGCNNGGATCFGGGMYNTLAANSVVTIINSQFSNNTSTSPAANGFGFAAGLGIESTTGFTLNISGSTFNNNQGVGTGTGGANGSGIRMLPTATSVANITNTSFTNNGGSGGSSVQGSGITAFTGLAGTGSLTGTWDRVTVSGNTGTGGGSGVFVDATSAPITINVINSTISGNNGGTAGGGIGLTNVGGTAASAVTFNFTNSTISGNTVSANGGGIFVEQPVATSAVTANFNYCTIANNSATTNGGGIFRSTAGAVNIKNSIVANNTSNGAGVEMAGTINSQDFNHFESTAGATITGTTTNNATGDPNIGILTGNGGVTLTHLPNFGSPVINTIPSGTSDCGTAVTTDQRGVARPAAGVACEKGSVEVSPIQHTLDFDGNGLTDWAVVRITGQPFLSPWYIMLNSAPQTMPFYTLGSTGDEFIPADYDGDNKTDIAVWRPTTGQFIAVKSATLTYRIETFGVNGDDPSVVGDYDGDGSDDLAVYRAGAQSVWYWRTAQNGPTFAVGWGTTNDDPAPGDYDGDGKYDFVVRRDDGGQGRFWRALTLGTQDTILFGNATDIIAPGDYDGDGKTDICVVRDKGGQLNWWVHPSTGGADTVNAWGVNTDIVSQGDYDGDGKTDRAIWRANPNQDLNFFFVDRSNGSGLLTQEWGQQGDYAVANFNTH